MNTWTEESQTNNAHTKRVIKLYTHIFHALSIIVCGIDAAEHSIKAATSHLARVKETSLCNKSSFSHSRLKENIVKSMEMQTNKHSVEFKISRAFICGSVTRKEFFELRDTNPNLSLSCNSYRQGVKHFEKLIIGEPIAISKKSLQRFDPASVDQAVAFILSNENVSFLSWGTKRIMLDGVVTNFPAITRKKSRSQMFAKYLIDNTVKTQTRIPINRTNFLKLASALTHKDQKLRRAVDYVTGFLVNDNFSTIQRLIDSFFLPTKKKEIGEEIELARRYLKYGFSDNLTNMSSTCAAHQLAFGLGFGTDIDVTNFCSSCSHLFYCMHYLTSTVSNFEPFNESALKAVKGCTEKVTLFMGHRIRVTNQQIEIQKILDSMKDRCLSGEKSNECLITIDYKMKLEPIYYREKTVDHYGKRGISWHGAMIQYFTLEESDGKKIAIQHKVYVDQIISNENKQDRSAVFSILEALLLVIKKHLPFIEIIYLLSDNAACYQNTMILHVLPYLAYAHELQISRFIHTETQDGKSVLDAHFATSTQKIYSYCKEGRVSFLTLLLIVFNHLF